MYKDGNSEEPWMSHVGKTLTRTTYFCVNPSRCPVDVTCRSRMNVPFRVGKKEGDEALEKEFLAGASKRGMISLKGHRLVKPTCTLSLLLY